MEKYIECPYCGAPTIVLNRIVWDDGSYTLEGYCGECARVSIDYDANGKEIGAE